MSNYLYSQVGSVKQIVYEGEKGLFIPPVKAKYINLAHISWVECTEKNDSLEGLVDNALISDSIYNNRLRGKDTIISLKIAESHLKDSLNTLQKTSIADKDKKIEKVTKGRNTWKVLGLSGWGAIIVAGLVLLL